MQTMQIKCKGEMNKLKTLFSSRGLNTSFYILFGLVLKHSRPVLLSAL